MTNEEIENKAFDLALSIWNELASHIEQFSQEDRIKSRLIYELVNNLSTFYCATYGTELTLIFIQDLVKKSFHYRDIIETKLRETQLQ